MKKALSIVFLSFVCLGFAQSVQSPSNAIPLDFKIGESGKPNYTVAYKTNR